MNLQPKNPPPKIRILLIEDNPGDARWMREQLAGAPTGFDLEVVDRLAAGLGRLAQGGLDLLLLDLSLPDSLGLETFDGVRERAGDLPIIVLSGSDDEELAIETVQRGAQDYLVKGRVDRHLLVRAIRYAIERKKTQQQLAGYAEELRHKNQQMAADLDMAREFQLALLPQKYPGFPRGCHPEVSALRFYHRYQPSAALGGDFFDVLALSDSLAGVFIGDVMGRGVRAALVAAMIRGLVEELRPVADDPGVFVTELNRYLGDVLHQTDTTMFASAFYMVIDVSAGTMRYANAGHPKPFHLRRPTGPAQPLSFDPGSTGPVLGLFAGSYYQATACPLAAEDLIVLYTDGLYEVAGTDDRQFGQERLQQAVGARRGLPPDRLFRELLEEIRRYSATGEFDDDVCLVGVEIARLGDHPAAATRGVTP